VSSSGSRIEPPVHSEAPAAANPQMIILPHWVGRRRGSLIHAIRPQTRFLQSKRSSPRSSMIQVPSTGDAAALPMPKAGHASTTNRSAAIHRHPIVTFINDRPFHSQRSSSGGMASLRRFGPSTTASVVAAGAGQNVAAHRVSLPRGRPAFSPDRESHAVSRCAWHVRAHSGRSRVASPEQLGSTLLLGHSAQAAEWQVLAETGTAGFGCPTATSRRSFVEIANRSRRPIADGSVGGSWFATADGAELPGLCSTRAIGSGEECPYAAIASY
jgi:hypothetical protein